MLVQLPACSAYSILSGNDMTLQSREKHKPDFAIINVMTATDMLGILSTYLVITENTFILDPFKRPQSIHIMSKEVNFIQL